jgi:CO/xanthine dehydrogenase FAD-binding subunit
MCSEGAADVTTAEVTVPTSPGEAAELFGDGVAVTVVGGGTIVVPLVTHRASPTSRSTTRPARCA